MYGVLIQQFKHEPMVPRGIKDENVSTAAPGQSLGAQADMQISMSCHHGVAQIGSAGPRAMPR
jgi:hypothetical protein